MINIALKCTTTTTTTTTINKNSIKEQKEFRKSMDLLVAVTRKQQDQHQEDSIVNVLDALVDSFPMHLVVKINTQRYHWESIHQEIQTDFLKVT
jgi:hypothetical protein